jgi:hypothetical protein
MIGNKKDKSLDSNSHSKEKGNTFTSAEFNSSNRGEFWMRGAENRHLLPTYTKVAAANKIQSAREADDVMSNGSFEKVSAPSDIAISRSPERRRHHGRDFATLVQNSNEHQQ